ncbi:BTAD domain-containing putative transcriptional regulator [Nocardia asteroides]|uniref:BTAD domain-containing putative transcriptional regulator n=1 Tax=Nocardia asteroides TaxID=1824 RepID=UPI0037C57254
MPDVAEIRIRVLGSFRVEIAQKPVAVGGARQQALLARLVLARGEMVGTPELIEDLWGDRPPARVRSVLQVQISNLRRILEPHRPPRSTSRVIVSEQSGYALRMAPECVDLWLFEHKMHLIEELNDATNSEDIRVRHRALTDALECWTGSAYEPFANAPWAASDLPRITDLRLTAHELHAQAALDLGRNREVVHRLRQVVTDNPAREESVRLLCTALLELDCRSEALAAIRRTRQHLLAEFGASLSQRLTHLESKIMQRSAHSEPALAKNRTSPPSGVNEGTSSDDSDPASSHFSYSNPERTDAFGYSAERQAIIDSSAEVRNSGMRVVVLYGEPGFGKTTLTESVIAELADLSWTTARGYCPELGDAPSGWGWREILAELDPSRIRHAHDASSNPFHIAHEISKACSNGQPVVIVLEDVHRADDVTVQVLQQLSIWLRRHPVLVIVTACRSRSSAATEAGLAALAPTTAARLELCGVDLEAAARIAESEGFTTVDLSLVASLWRHTMGNPFYVREFAAMLATTESTSTIPPRVGDAVRARISQLPEECIAALQILAVRNEGTDAELLAEFTSSGIDTALGWIELATRAQITTMNQLQGIAFHSRLIKDVVLEGISLARRAQLQRNLDEFSRRQTTI